jgi:hypothetical protein
MKELLKTPTTMTQANPLTISQIENIQKGYDELMERNKQTLEWMKRVGLTK